MNKLSLIYMCNFTKKLDAEAIALVNGTLPLARQKTHVKSLSANVPVTDTYQHHRKTGNFALDAPRFLSPEFFPDLQKGTVTLDKVVTPSSVVEIYRVGEDTDTQCPLSEAMSGDKSLCAYATVNVDEDGRFSYTLGNLKAGERVSAIASHQPRVRHF